MWKLKFCEVKQIAQIQTLSEWQNQTLNSSEVPQGGGMKASAPHPVGG